MDWFIMENPIKMDDLGVPWLVVSNSSFYMFYFHTENWGFMIQFDEHIFQMGGSTTTLYIYIYTFAQWPRFIEQCLTGWYWQWESTKWVLGVCRAALLHETLNSLTPWDRRVLRCPTPNLRMKKIRELPNVFYLTSKPVILKWKCVWLVIGHVFFWCLGQMLCFSRFMLGCLMFVFRIFRCFLVVCLFLSFFDVRCFFDVKNHVWVVVSNIFHVHPYLGKWSNFDWYFFRWVETTNQHVVCFIPSAHTQPKLWRNWRLNLEKIGV